MRLLVAQLDGSLSSFLLPGGALEFSELVPELAGRGDLTSLAVDPAQPTRLALGTSNGHVLLATLSQVKTREGDD